MAQTLYAPLNGVSDEVKKILVSTSGLSNYVVKGYCSVNGLSKLFFGDGGEDTGFWFYYSTVAEKIIQYRPIASLPPLVDSIVNKLNNGIAFYCITTDNTGSCVLTLSTDRNAIDYVNIEGGQYSISPTIGNITINDEVWYFAYYDMRPNATAYDIVPDCAIVNQSFSSMTPAQIVTWVINNRIYANNFAENYQIGQSYTLSYGNIEKTLRKIIGIFLFKNVSLKSNASYSALLANIETIVTNVLNDIGSNKIVNFDIFSISGMIRLNYRYTNANIPSKQIIQTTGDNDYTCYEIQTSIDTDVAKFVYINQDGNISYRDGITQPINYLGVYLNSYSGTLMLSNIGLDL